MNLYCEICKGPCEGWVYVDDTHIHDVLAWKKQGEIDE